MAAGAGVATPLRLKDLLELDRDSCSAAGFRCYPRRLGESAPPIMRHLLESPRSLQLRRRPSKLSNLSRSLSRRLGRGGLWRRRSDGHEDAAAPSGSGSDSSDTTMSDDNSFGRRRGSRCGSDSDFSTASSASDTVDDGTAAAVVAAAIGDEHEAMKRRGSSSGSEADDKDEQLSPVAVMDFPSDDDDDDDDCDGGERDAGVCPCSSPPSFSLERLQRRKMPRQHKIRRFGSTEELGPVDLEARLAATSDTDDPAADGAPAAQQVIQCRITEDATAAASRPSSSSSSSADARHDPDEEHGLLALLMDAGVDHVSKQLLLDFFVEMKRRRGSGELSSPAGLLLPRNAERWRWGGGEVLAAARGWLSDGAGSERWGLSDVLRAGEAVVEEMERSRRWMRVGEEEGEVGAVVAGMLADRLVDEVVWDLLV